MGKTRSSAFSPWSALLVAPAILFAVFLMPGLGDYGEGLWPEFYADAQKGTEFFGEIAGRVRIWAIGTLLIALGVVAAVYFWTIQAWRARLRTFNLAQVDHYLRFVWARVGVTFGLALVLAIFVLISAPLQDADADLPRWVIFVVAVGVFSVLQFLMLTFGLPTTRTLYRGK